MVEMVKKILVLRNLNDYRMILSNTSTTIDTEEGNQIIISDHGYLMSLLNLNLSLTIPILTIKYLTGRCSDNRLETNWNNQ